MIKMVAVFRRRQGMSFEAFGRHYETTHVPLIKTLMGDDICLYLGDDVHL